MEIFYKVHKTRMKTSTKNLILFSLSLIFLLFTASAEYVYKEDTLPEVLHHLTPFYNFSTVGAKEMEGIIRTTQFWAESPLLNQTGIPGGFWASTHNVNWAKAAEYMKENELENFYLCEFYMSNFPGLDNNIYCFNWTKDAAVLFLNQDDPAVWYQSIKRRHDYFLATQVIIMAIGQFGNILIIVVLVKFKNMKNPTNVLLGSLACNDLLVSGVYPAVLLYHQFWLRFMPPGNLGCNFIEYIEKTLFVNSVFHLTAVSFERFFAICMAMKVKTICTMKRAKILAPSLWVCAAVASIPSVITKRQTWTDVCVYTINYVQSAWFGIHKTYELAILVGIPFLLILHNYSRIIITLIKSLRQNAALMEGSNSQGSTRNDNEDVRKRMKVVKMLVAIAIVFIFCWMPRLIFDAIYGLKRTSMLTKHSRAFMGDFQAGLASWSFVNSAINAPIYFFTSNQFNKAFKRALTCGRLGKDERVTSMITQSSMASTSVTEKPSVNPSKT